MNNFQYVSRKEYMPMKKMLIELINKVQKHLKKDFTFSFDFIGSTNLNMVTYEPNANVGFDFDVNIKPNDDDENFTAKQLKTKLMNAFNIYAKEYGYDYCEDGTRVFTIKVKDRKKSRVLHSCDFAIVYDYEDEDGDERQSYVHHNKKSNTYSWQDQPNGYYMLPEKLDWIYDNGLWQEFRDEYLKLKNKNNNPDKKSRSLRAEAAAHIYNEYQEYDYDDDDDDYYN